MAAQADQVITCNHTSSRVSNVSSKSASSNKSFSSWGSRKPRDSLEKMRKRQRVVEAARSLPARHVTLLRNYSVQEEEEMVEEEDSTDTWVKIFRPPINRGIICERYPKGKASLLVFVLNIIVSYAFGAAITGILNIFHTEHDGHHSSAHLGLLHLLFQYCVSRMFYPIAGFIADVYIGRCRMINISILSIFTGYGILVVSFILEGQTNIHTPVTVLHVIRVVSFLFISAGGGAFEATIIPFGVDQLQGASSAEISSYFHFFYFGRNLGMVCGIFMYGLVSYSTDKILAYEYNSNESQKLNAYVYSVFQPLVTISILTIGLVLNVCLYHWYFKNTLWENPVKLVAKVLCYAATVKRHLPVHRRAFRYGEEKKKRIDLAKIEYDGKFSGEKVEDVKSFCRICLLMFTLIPTLFSLNGFNTIISYEMNTTMAKFDQRKFFVVNFYPFILYVINSFIILLSLPVINFCVIPIFPKLTIRARIGVGVALYCIGNITVVIIHAAALTTGEENVKKPQLWCLLVPIAILAVAEVFTMVSVLEFIYAQSPESMKGLLTGLFYFFGGLSSIGSSLMFYLYSRSLENKTLVPFYTALTIVQVIGVVFYGIAAALHRNRLRPDEDSFSSNQQLIIEDQLN